MAENKSYQFTTREQKLSSYAEALSHPAKVSILELLAENGEMTCGEITNELPLAQPTVSQHLKKLKKSGLLSLRKDGLKSIYCLEEGSISEMRTAFYEIINKLSNPL